MLRFLIRSFLYVLILQSLCQSQKLWALSELSAIVRDQYVLKSAPQFDADNLDVEVLKNERTFVLGTSLDNAWTQVLKRNGKSGWIPIGMINLHRVDQEDYDDFYFALMRERRQLSRWNWELGGSFGTTPFGLGGETMLRLNLYKEGALVHKSDQLEIGTGIRYHLGASPSPTLNGSGNLVSDTAKPFYEVPLELSLMFRLGYRGDLLIGPHFGVSFVKDPYARFNPAMPAVAGINVRYFPRDQFGVYLHSWIHIRSVIYYSASGGVTWRF